MNPADDFRLGDIIVYPSQNRVSGPRGDFHLNSRSMDVLLYLAERAGEVVSREDFNRHVWHPAVVADDALTRCISELRRALGDTATNPGFIETIPKRGYRLVAPIVPLECQRKESRPLDRRVFPLRRKWLQQAITLAALAVVAVIMLWLLGNPWRAATSPTPSSIAVLPFQTLSADTDTAFAAGIHHDLLTRLANIGQLQVISATSVQRYQSGEHSIRQIADELGVAWVLEGAVQQLGDQIQVNAQLIDATNDFHLWARTYRQTLTAENLFAMQAEIMEDIAESLQAQLTPAETVRVERRGGGVDLDSYRLYARAQLLLKQRTGEDMKRASELFRMLTERDPDHALAWAGLANALGLRAGYRHEPAEKMLPEAEAAVERALALNPDLVEAREARARILFYRREGPAAVREIRHAIDLSPSHDVAHEVLGIVLVTLGQPEEAVGHLERAVELGPMAPENRLALAIGYLALHRPHDALEQARRAVEIQPGYRSGSLVKLNALVHLGQFETALERAETLNSLRYMALASVGMGNLERARSLVAKLEARGSQFGTGIVNAALGESERGLEQMTAVMLDADRSIHSGGLAIPFRYYYPDMLAALRDHPRYQESIRELNRFWNLEADGRFPDDPG